MDALTPADVMAWPTAEPTPLELHRRPDDLLTPEQVFRWLLAIWGDAEDPVQQISAGYSAHWLLMLRDEVDAGGWER